MDVILYIAFTMQMHHVVALCMADNIIYGILEKDSFKTSFDEAVRYLNSNSSNTFIRINPNQGLKQVIETGLTFTSALQQHKQDNVFLFIDLNNQNNGIIREVLEFQTTRLQNANVVRVESALDIHQKARDQRHEIDALFVYINKLISPTKGLSVVVDNSQLGHDAFIQIIQNCTESGREIIGYCILMGEVTEEALLALNLHHSNNLFAGIDQSSFQQIINMSEVMGLVSFNHKMRMFMTKRSIAGIAGICYKPKYNYYIADNQLSPSNATYIVDKVNMSKSSSNGADQLAYYTRNHGKIIKKLDVNTNTWVAAYNPDSEKEYLTTSTNGKQPIPTITASIAGSVPPWVMYVDYERTVDDTVICGREGMKGVGYNGSQKVEICVYGFTIDVFQALRKKLNVDYRLIVSRDGQYGSYYKERNTSSGIVREIIERNSDIALDLMENKPRSQVLWFSRLYVISGIGLMYVKTGYFSNSWIFKPFDSNLWIAFLGSVMCITVFIWALERFSPYGRYNTNQRSICGNAHTFNIFDSANYVWGTYFTGEIIVEKPTSFGSRATIAVISMIATIIIASYSGNLITYLLVVDEKPPINNLLDDRLIGQNPTVTVGTIDGSVMVGYLREHSDPRLRALYKRLNYCQLADCVKRLKTREFDMLLYEHHTLKYVTDIDKDCTLKTILLQKDSGVAIAALKSWTWKRRIDAAISYMVESGEVDYLIRRWFGQESCKSSNAFHSIDLQKLKDLFVFLSTSILIASFVLVIEIAWKRLH